MKAQKKGLSLSLCFLLSALLLAGCGGSAEPTSTSGAETPAYENDSSEKYELLMEESGVSRSTSPALRDAKLIYTGELILETDDFEQARQQLDKLVEQYGGYYQNASSSVDPTELHRKTGRFTVRVPQENFHPFLSQVDGICNVLEKNTQAEDVGEQYFDTETRLNTLRTKQERYLALLEKAEKIEDIIKLQEIISDTQYEIDQFATDLKHYDALISFSTIKISLHEVGELTAQEKSGYIDRLGIAVYSGLTGSFSTVGELLIFIAYSLPLIVVIALFFLIIFLIVRWRRRKEAKKNSGDNQLK